MSYHFPSLKEQMHEWLSFWMWWPQVKEVRVLPATDFSEEDANNCEKKVDLELRTTGMGSSRGMWESVIGGGWQGGLLDGCGTVTCGILVSQPGILNLGPRQYKCGGLTIRLPGNSWFWRGVLCRLEALPGVPGGPWRDAFLIVRHSAQGSSPHSRPMLLEVWSADWCHEISTNIESKHLEISIAACRCGHFQVHQQWISLSEQDIDPFEFCGAETFRFTPGWRWELAMRSGTTGTS